MCTVYQVGGIKDYTDVLDILEAPDKNLVSKVPPSGKIDNNSVYVFDVTGEKDFYWRLDTHQWRLGRTRNFPRKNSEKVLHSCEYILKSRGELVDFKRIEYFDYGAKLGNVCSGWIHPYVVCHYIGSFDTTSAVSVAHGNKKQTHITAGNKRLVDITHKDSPNKQKIHYQNTSVENKTPVKRQLNQHELNEELSACKTLNFDSPTKRRCYAETNDLHPNQPQDNLSGSLEASTSPFLAVRKSVTQDVTKLVEKGMKPAQVYRNVLIQAEVSDAGPQGTPRNLKQVQNAAQKIKAENQHDDIYSIYAFHYDTPGFINIMHMVPYFLLSFGHPEMFRHIQSLDRKCTRLVFNYDTLYGQGPYYLSILSARHPVFQGEPVIPIAFAMHQFNDQDPHNDLFRTLINIIPALNSSTSIIVTDRELAIRNAIRDVAPGLKNLLCWYHIDKNVRKWGKDHFDEEFAVKFSAQIFELLSCENEKIYVAKRSIMIATWDDTITRYFNAHIDEDLRSSARWVLEQLGLYNTKSGITNNASESVNAVVAAILREEDSPMTSAVTSLYLLQSTQLLDIRRGLNKSGGQWELKQNYQGCKVYVPNDVQDIVDPTVITSIIFEGTIPSDANMIEKRKLPPARARNTQIGLAKLLLVKGRILHIAEKGSFIVTGIGGENKFLVDLGKNTCTCTAKGACSHIIACLMSINMFGPKMKYPSRSVEGVGGIYKKKSAKATGKKGPLRPRVRVVKSGIPITRLDSANGLSSSFAEKPPAKIKVSASILELLPSASDAPLNQIVLEIGNIKIAYADLYSLKTNLMNEEIFALQSVYPDMSLVQTGWLTDNIITVYGKILAESNSSMFLETFETQHLIDGIFNTDGETMIPEALIETEANKQVLQTYKLILGLYSIPPFYNHYVLLWIDPVANAIGVFDPVAEFIPTSEQIKRLGENLNQLFDRDTDWVYYNLAEYLQNDGTNCGVYVCYMIKCFLEGCPITLPLDTDNFRSSIFSVISEACEIHDTSITRFTTCVICKNPESKDVSKVVCQRCHRWVHQTCTTINMSTCKDWLKK